MVKKHIFKIWGIAVALLFAFILQAFAACDECNVTKSCEAYQECMAAKVNCMAACKEREAAEITAASSERMMEVQEKTIETLKEIFVIAERTAELLEKIALKLKQTN